MSLLAHPWGETIFFLWIAQNQEWVEPGVWSNSLFCKSLRLEQLKQQGGVIVTSLCGFLPSPAKATPHQPSTGSVCVQCLQRLFSRQPPQMPCCAVFKPAWSFFCHDPVCFACVPPSLFSCVPDQELPAMLLSATGRKTQAQNLFKNHFFSEEEGNAFSLNFSLAFHIYEAHVFSTYI